MLILVNEINKDIIIISKDSIKMIEVIPASNIQGFETDKYTKITMKNDREINTYDDISTIGKKLGVK